jgi:hypothetical protein
LERIPPATLSLAEEIRVSSEQAGFWPMVPRIPVYLELKAYAHWFGQRQDNSPRGVLTFLSERLAVAVEQTVLVGTLKRALGEGAWIFIFDGLDEVPHDVKDNIATEVIHFLDNVVGETNADVFALCTSRPQGYAGEFAELDGPLAELVDLSSDQALSCAEPVVRLGRSAAEADEAMTKLRAAVASPPVRVLMTTPLQAHIMAVVVRNGATPPERKWQLFTNFYQTIRQREANRNLPNARLARLLREEERLLRAVHNRLGFVLHARAERSSGAQTNLTKDEFRSLVTDVVASMKTQAVEQTVETLVEAATERLVLVSTPDDGGHVRFDIRPLQEFFAAEFLYESANADILRERLEVIIKDSHWLEVVHFLLSALVEGQRRTEWSVAVQALQNVNEENGGTTARLVSRRTARGAHHAARLLVEGVLEQDKRVRQEIRSAIEPLGGVSHVESLEEAISVNQPESREWLLGTMFTALRELSRAENIGAAIILFYTLPDTDGRTTEVRRFLSASPPGYRARVLAARREALPPRGVIEFSAPVQEWIASVALDALVSPRWNEEGAENLRVALDLIRAYARPISKLDALPGLSDGERHLLREAIQAEGEDPVKYGTNTIDIGVFGIIPYERDWSTGPVQQTSEFETALSTDPTIRGYFRLLFAVRRFAEHRTTERWKAVSELLQDPNGQLLYASLPNRLAALLPVGVFYDIESQIKLLDCVTEAELQEVLSSGRLRGRELARPGEAFVDHRHNSRTWARSCAIAPALVLDVMRFTEFSGSYRDWFSDQDGRPRRFHNVFITDLIKRPNLLVKHPESWANLIAMAGSQEQALREALIRECSVCSPEQKVGYGVLELPFTPFPIRLPTEAAMLPHIASTLLANVEVTHRLSDVFGPYKPSTEILQELVPNPDVLEDIVAADSEPRTVRGAALLLLMLHPDSPRSVEESGPLVSEFYELGALWYTKAVADYLRGTSSERSVASRALVGRLLDATRERYNERLPLEILLATWRERSWASVQEGGYLERWLAAE